MKKLFLTLALVLVPVLSFAVTDQEVRDMMIKESISSYPGNCPCPYNTMRNGRSCGGRSAYSRPGGRSPLCYPNDIPYQMVEAFRLQRKIK